MILGKLIVNDNLILQWVKDVKESECRCNRKIAGNYEEYNNCGRIPLLVSGMETLPNFNW